MSNVAKLVSRNVAPIHAHDCGCCRFVGRLDGKDLYIDRDGSYLARYGSEDYEYRSLGDLTPAGSPYALASVLAKRGGAPNEYTAQHDSWGL